MHVSDIPVLAKKKALLFVANLRYMWQLSMEETISKDILKVSVEI